MPVSPLDRIDQAATAPGTSIACPLAGLRRVLLVDDDEAVRTVSAILLEELGFQVQQAEGGAEALAAIAAWGPGDAPDVALLDIAMPGVNGVQVATGLRARHPDMPIIFITGYADLSAPVEHVLMLQKPYRETQLQAMLDLALPPPAAQPPPT